MSITPCIVFSDEQRYLFDLQGYVILRQVVPTEVLDLANQAMQRLESLGDGELPPRVVLGAERTPANLYISNILESSHEFDAFIDLPAVMAVIAGVVTRGGGSGLLADFVRPVPDRGFSSHCHAVVFPYRPLRRGGLDLAATVADLAASTPLAVLHLVADPHPVLGSGRSELARGGVWFAPLELGSGEVTA
jgi:hypothetical protein